MSQAQDRQIEPLIRIVVEEVLRALGLGASAAPSSLPSSIVGGDICCLFYDASTGLEEVGRQLGFLKNQGVSFGCMNLPPDAPLSISGLPWKDRLPLSASLPSLWDRYKTCLIVNLSRRGLSELATGVTASPVSEMVYRAVGKRIRVLAIEDPLRTDRVKDPSDPIHLSPVRRTLEEQREKALELGIELIASESVLEHLSQPLKTANLAEDAYRGFVTLEDLEGFQGRQIRLLRGTKLTPLAEEWLRDRGIELRWIDPQ